MKARKILISLVIASFFVGCATYYEKSLQFQTYIGQGQFEQADAWLNTDKFGKREKNKTLHLLDKGYVSRMRGNYDSSNAQLMAADRRIEDYHKQLGTEALSIITNPTVKPYKVEDFENVMLNYYMALNYISLNKREDARVECRRINNKLNALNDKYKDNKNRYQRDAFAHLLMGAVYEADRDYNNAFIAYRNAYEAYKTDYATNFGVNVPQQLKYDLLRTAHLTGFQSDVLLYKKEFGIDYAYSPAPAGELVFLWESGFGPVKAEWGIDFVSGFGNGYLALRNDELGLFFNLYVGNDPSFRSLSFLRIAFPKYVERVPVFTSANLTLDGYSYKCEPVQDINEIAFKCLRDRMLREVSNSVLRLATKKAMEMAVRSQDQTLGTLVSIANAVSEKADTRNWQTLPHTIYYARVPLHEGINTITFNARGANGKTDTQTFTFKGEKGKTHFFNFQNLASFSPSNFNNQ